MSLWWGFPWVSFYLECPSSQKIRQTRIISTANWILTAGRNAYGFSIGEKVLVRKKGKKRMQSFWTPRGLLRHIYHQPAPAKLCRGWLREHLLTKTNRSVYNGNVFVLTVWCMNSTTWWLAGMRGWEEESRTRRPDPSTRRRGSVDIQIDFPLCLLLVVVSKRMHSVGEDLKYSVQQQSRVK